MAAKILSNIGLNILASVFPIFLLQFFLFPVIASRTTADSYGQFLTIVGIMSLFASTIGNVLNNSRLLNFKKYDEEKITGDYNLLLVGLVLVNIFLMGGALWFFVGTNFLLNFFILMASILLLLIDYGRVEFRIRLNYKKMLCDSFFLMAGYIIGFLFFLKTGNWLYIYFFGYAMSFLYILKKTTLFQENFTRTYLFKQTASQTLLLLTSGLLIGAGTYIDRILLFPLLGGEAVSIYFIATILGKTLFLVIQPVAGVMLSYLAGMQKFQNKLFFALTGTAIILGGFGYVMVVLISKPVLYFLYPNYAAEALMYIKVTTLASIISLASNIINPVIMRFCHLKWQVFINATYMLNYTFVSLLFLKHLGLFGFCVGIVIAGGVNFVFMVILYYVLNIRSKALVKGTA
ncbi:hypothetical protein MO973_21010 [Paenibacillus sp. TRM 82003]|nr:hypothetical protein [Paenibacillus sp. TRM 82003]